MPKLMMLLMATFALSGCQATRQAGIPDSSCVAFSVIHPSRVDTADTKRQVLQHNTTWRRICEPGRAGTLLSTAGVTVHPLSR